MLYCIVQSTLDAGTAAAVYHVSSILCLTVGLLFYFGAVEGLLKHRPDSSLSRRAHIRGITNYYTCFHSDTVCSSLSLISVDQYAYSIATRSISLSCSKEIVSGQEYFITKALLPETRNLELRSLTRMPRKLKIEFGAITHGNIEQVRFPYPDYHKFSWFMRFNHISQQKYQISLPSRLLFTYIIFLQLRKINTASFPIQYNEGFYKDVLKRNNDELNKFAYCNEFVVGALCARVEETEAGSGQHRLYIMTLAVLAAYRGRGIGSQLLQSILDYCERRRTSRSEEGIISEIALHVQISNDDAIRFYTRRFGFVQGEMVENYYKRIDPPHCYQLYKKLETIHQQRDELRREDV